MYVPTILIGVGGIGSSIVNEIYGKLTDEMLSQTVILAMDTDVNWIKGLRNLPDNNIIQTSTDQTVGQYIYNKKRMGDDSIGEWFQNNILELDDKNMTDGAGQVRAVSRLAFRGAIERNEINKIRSEITRINEQTDNKYKSSVRVCIVGTLAGGTGSGIFLQVPLMIRKILRESFGVETMMSVGFFLLGGVLQGCGKITGQDEVRNIFANTYASFKELNALTVNASSAENQLNIKFEYDPHSSDPSLSKKDRPYDYYHIIDHLNLNGKNLPSLSSYVNMISNSVYVYLFSPIADGSFSKMDNQIIKLAENTGKTRVCGSAAGKLFYPYDDIVRLFSLRRTLQSIGTVWQKYDKQFDRDKTEFKRKRMGGDTKVEEPILRKKFLFYLEQEIKKDNPDPNFRVINQQLNVYDENGEITGRKSQIFVQEIENHIQMLIKVDKKTNELANSIQPDYDNLIEPGAARDEIDNLEERLRLYERAADEFVANNSALVRNILLDDEHKDLENQDVYIGENFYLNNYILGNEILHPIAARAFIYEVMELLEIGIKKGKNELEKSEKGFESLKNHYNEGDEGKNVQDALNEVTGGGIMSLLGRKKKLRMFADEYEGNVDDRKNRIKKLEGQRISYKTKEKLYTRLDQFVRIIEKFFKSLNRILDKYNTEIKVLENKYTSSQEYNQPVLSSPSLLEKLWDDKSNAFISFDEVPEDLSKSIYLSFYKKFCQKVANDNINVEYSDNFIKQISEKILEKNSKTIKDSQSLDFDIIEAINYEATLLGKDPEQREVYLEDQLTKLMNRVEAFGPDNSRVDYGKSSFYSMWGVNDEVAALLPEDLRNRLEKQDKEDSSFIIDSNFDKREIIRSKILMGQTLDQFLKFYPGDNNKSPGDYYRAYQERIRELNSSNQTITPHLDKRWHLPHYLPEIFTYLDDRIENNAIDTLLRGLVTKKLAIRNIGGVPNWTYNNERIKDENGKKINGLNINLLLDAVLLNPVFQDDIFNNYDERLHADVIKFAKEFNSYDLIKEVRDIYYPPVSPTENIHLLDVILHFFKNLNTTKDEEKGKKILIRLKDLLYNMVHLSDQYKDDSLKKEDYKKFVEEYLLSTSIIFKTIDRNDVLYSNIKNLLEV